MDYSKWARKNKKQLITEIVGDVTEVPDKEKPVAVFMAGIPGAGKTEFINRAIDKPADVVRIDLVVIE
jgi:signal recognition particle GTPase